MYGITIIGHSNSYFRKMQTQCQQKLAGQISSEVKSRNVEDCLISANSVTVPSVQESMPRDESCMEILQRKLLLGSELSEDDLKYLKNNSPELYDEYMAAENLREQEEKAYQQALKCCRTREDVSRLKNMSISRCAARASCIAKDNDISKQQKAIRIGAERRKLSDIYRNNSEFMRSSKYAGLPSEKKAASRGNTVSSFSTLQLCADIAGAEAKERAAQRTKNAYAPLQSDVEDVTSRWSDRA